MKTDQPMTWNNVKYLVSVLIFMVSTVSAAADDGRVDFKISLKASTAGCIERRGALDFGSGTTKALVIKVNKCQKKILDVVYEDRLPLALNEALEKSSDNTIPPELIEGSLPKMEKMLSEMKKHKAKTIQAVATSVFRKAKNGKAVIKNLSKELDVKIDIISQEEEAELGYWSALAGKDLKPSPEIIVWDIGGGSMQMYAKSGKRREIFEGDLASVSFKNQVLEVLQFKKPQDVYSPNPLGTDKDSAVQLADNHAVLEVPKFFKKQGPKARWIGVGGVLSASVQKQIHPKKNEFTREQLQVTLNSRAFLEDSQIPGEYRATEITNLALVLGYMKALGIKKIETIPASLGQGLIYRQLQTKNAK